MTYVEREEIASLTINVGTRRKWSFNTPAALFLGKELPVLIEKENERATEPVGTLGRRKDMSIPCR
jgi:hypothetical protein